ncbi:sigma-54-dependent Fis family transcriptional regulator [Limnohabitans sp. 2KL-3]|uniref:sigma-54 interaction domain-containing protein n=1 Tax=Limnohabitans sp. 2KL-3 TaxID=1100700 RepID=UPI000AB6C657|nr:sigma-54 dependent transcriptional regulator [Limnohabitans sp. 2KL-3]
MKVTLKPQILGPSRATQFLRELIQTLSTSSSTALVTGESGTGKELVAQALHAQGPRSAGPFVPINCGAIPRDLIESELFGHRKGAFTGAVADRLGRFELAHGGTLFLDEIGDLPMDMQVKLLRVLQERCILPVGGSREVPIDVRVVAATHKNLEAEVAAGRFREDLYYRINVLPITTTALRERPDDVACLLAFYADKHVLPGQRPLKFAPDMLKLLQAYAWPGNVRELSNLVDRFSTLFPSQTLHVHTVPACMMPSGLAVLQAQRLNPVSTVLPVLPTPLAAPVDARPSNPVVQVFAVDEASGAPADPASASPWDESDPLIQFLGGGDEVRSPSDISAMPPMALSASNDEMSTVEEVILLAQGIQMLPPDGISIKQHLIDIERTLIEQALNRTQGNVSQTAKLLQLQRTTLIEKINKYELRGFA